MGWDACTQEPLAVIRWIECHPGTAGWVQTVGILLAIGTAVVIPWIIHTQQQRAPAKSEARFNAGVQDALRQAREAIKEFLSQGAICFSTEAKTKICKPSLSTSSGRFRNIHPRWIDYRV